MEDRSMPLYTKYEGIRYDDPALQAELQRLIEAVAAAERARAPIQQQQREAEARREAGDISEREFRQADDKFIAANNSIAAAMKQVDEFLGRYKNYRVVS
jgi:outer membrane protein TolC